MTGEPVTAKRAAEIGLVNAVVAGDVLDAHAERIAGVIASRSPSGAQTAKRVIRDGQETTLAEGLALERAALKDILASADYAEGLAAFAEKRAPRFSGAAGLSER